MLGYCSFIVDLDEQIWYRLVSAFDCLLQDGSNALWWGLYINIQRGGINGVEKVWLTVVVHGLKN